MIESAFRSLRSPAEAVGAIAIVLGMIGGLAQLLWTHRTQSFASFAPLYISLALVAEILLAVQGAILRSPSIVLTRAGSALYFGYFLVMMMLK